MNCLALNAYISYLYRTKPGNMLSKRGMDNVYLDSNGFSLSSNHCLANMLRQRVSTRYIKYDGLHPGRISKYHVLRYIVLDSIAHDVWLSAWYGGITWLLYSNLRDIDIAISTRHHGLQRWNKPCSGNDSRCWTPSADMNSPRGSYHSDIRDISISHISELSCIYCGFGRDRDSVRTGCFHVFYIKINNTLCSHRYFMSHSNNMCVCPCVIAAPRHTERKQNLYQFTHRSYMYTNSSRLDTRYVFQFNNLNIFKSV